MLEVSPETEVLVREYAKQEGVSIDTLFRRTFASRQSIEKFMRHRADEEKRAAVLRYINSSPEEVACLHAPTIARLQAKLDSVSTATSEEISEADAEWQIHKKNISENRLLNSDLVLGVEEILR